MNLDRLFDLWEGKGYRLYMVGGCVRDRLLGRPVLDYDLCTDSSPEETMELLRTAGCRPHPVGIAYGTVSAGIDTPVGHSVVQITTFRNEERYFPGSRHPEVRFGKDLEADLARRDFTINAMAMDRRGRLIDPLGGREDLERRLVRTPGPPGETFAEDPLRMLRAFRFACILGFGIEESTFRAISDRHELILDISRERWKMEMDRLLSARDGGRVAYVLDLMKRSGMLSDMIPELEGMFDSDGLSRSPAHRYDVWRHTLETVSGVARPSAVLRWAALLHDLGKPGCMITGEDGIPHFYGHERLGAELSDRVARRFRFSRKERRSLKFLVGNHMRPVLYSTEWSDRAVDRLAADAGDNLELLLELAKSDISAHDTSYAEKGLERLEELARRLERSDAGKRLLPRKLGKILAEKGLEGRRLAGVLAEFRELVSGGVLPAMAPPRIYLDYLEDHPEMGKGRMTLDEPSDP